MAYSSYHHHNQKTEPKGGPEWLQWKYPEWYMERNRAMQERCVRTCLRGLTLERLARSPCRTWIEWEDLNNREDTWEAEVAAALPRRAAQEFKFDARGEAWAAFAAGDLSYSHHEQFSDCVMVAVAMAGVDATDWHNPDAMLSFHRFQRIRNLRLGFAHCCGAVKDGDGIVLLLAGSGERLDDDMTQEEFVAKATSGAATSEGDFIYPRVDLEDRMMWSEGRKMYLVHCVEPASQKVRDALGVREEKAGMREEKALPTTTTTTTTSSSSPPPPPEALPPFCVGELVEIAGLANAKSKVYNGCRAVVTCLDASQDPLRVGVEVVEGPREGRRVAVKARNLRFCLAPPYVQAVTSMRADARSCVSRPLPPGSAPPEIAIARPGAAADGTLELLSLFIFPLRPKDEAALFALAEPAGFGREKELVAYMVSGLLFTSSTHGSLVIVFMPRTPYGTRLYGRPSHGGAPFRPDQPRSWFFISEAAK